MTASNPPVTATECRVKRAFIWKVVFGGVGVLLAVAGAAFTFAFAANSRATQNEVLIEKKTAENANAINGHVSEDRAQTIAIKESLQEIKTEQRRTQTLLEELLRNGRGE